MELLELDYSNCMNTNHEPYVGSSLTMAILARQRSVLRLVVLLFGLSLLHGSLKAQTADKFYFWVTGAKESFVIEVDANMANTIRSGWTQGRIGVRGQIATGAVPYNKDYYSSVQRTWKWHFASVEGIIFIDGIFPACECPYLVANPSEIDANPDEWIRQNGTYYSPKRYIIVSEINPSKPDAMVNVSNRGVTGAGETTLITGFIVTGGQPRNVVVRGLGPSLSNYGVRQVAANPKIIVYQGSTQIATNADWKTDTRSARLAQNYPSLAPTNDKEAALLLTLLPGTYTLQGINEDGTEGIMILEAYDVDSATPP